MNRGIKVLQTSALPLGYVAVNGRAHRGSTYINKDLSILGSKTMGTMLVVPVFSGADYGDRTRHLDLGKVALYQMS